MKFHYIVRLVEPGAICSYPVGRTLLRDTFRCPEEAQIRAAIYNKNCNCQKVYYLVKCLPEDIELTDFKNNFGIDYLENGNITL